MPNKIDSNITGLRFSQESALGVAGSVWYPLEPNSYRDFGGSIATIARNPINASRQRKKGVVTDLDAAGGFVTDLTQSNIRRLLQGFMFAAIREKPTTAPMNSAATALTATTTSTYTAASGLAIFLTGRLIAGFGFAQAANNGVKRITTGGVAGTVTVAETLVVESPPATAYIKEVGVQAAIGDIDVDASGTLPALTSTTLNFTTLGLVAGEWIFIGGDLAGDRFTNAVNNGFARVRSIAANRLELDKTASTMVTEANTTATIRLFYGDVLKNESDPNLIVRRSYQLERTLGNDGGGTQSEYIVGAVPNELTLNVRQADKITVEMSFVATDHEQRTGVTGVKSGTRPTLTVETAFNTSSDFSRTKLALVSDTDEAITPLFAFAQEFTLTINNNVSPDKAVAVLGAFDLSVGTFEVGGSITAYFGDTTGPAAVRNNSDVTQDFVIVKSNQGMVFDVGLLALGDGRLNVEQDQSIKLPLENSAAENRFNHTLLLGFMDYLPTAAG